MIGQVIFDFNGTILDDRDLCLEGINELLLLRGHQPITLQKYLDIFTFPVEDYYVKAGFDFPQDDFVDLSKRFIAKYQPNSMNCHLCYGILEALQELKQRGVKRGC